MPHSASSRTLTPAVAIPARDEAERLPDLLASLAGQSWLGGSRVRLPVHIVLNNTTDQSADVIRRSAKAHPRLDIRVCERIYPPRDAHVGSARRLAMGLALQGFGSDARGVVLTTDADARPDPDWIASNLAAIAGGADVVGGRIIGDPAEEAALGPGFRRRARDQHRYTALCDQLTAAIDPLPHDPWPRHRDHTGASLAVTADALAAVGGLPALPFREDLALVSRLRAAGFRLVHPETVRVGVSARLNGRAPGGMADCLKTWIDAEAQGRPHRVEEPAAVVARALCRRAFRDRDGPHAAALIERWAADDPDAPGVVPVLDAIVELEDLIARRVAQDVW
ncbi:glycosyltransferase [Brevundimonas sp. R86498]|uniref:glycosyltransferase n=1 Tax=Brevundimonas sp. R86498 TaxID=3093845 RepID=UPI0037C98A5E